jgi:S1-C subfamily serine protease
MELSAAVRRSLALVGAASLAAVTSCAGPVGQTAPTPTAVASPSPAAVSSEIPQGALALESAYERVIKKVLPSIVQINAGSGLGSGVVFDATGNIVTNAHVVGDAEQLQVTLATGGQPRSAKLVGAFPAGDLAVIKVDDPQGLTPATFGKSAQVEVGQIVLAMGNPLGFSGSVTQGIVSALGRTVSNEGDGGVPTTIGDAIQTSAAINRGNSGGALVDLAGQVIGIPTLTATDPELGAANGIGFAIPSDTATDIAGQIIKNGKVVNTHRAALGVRVGTAVDPAGNPVGVAVGDITPGGGADKAGIAKGDVILSVNGTPTPDATALSQTLAALKPGDQCKVEVLHPTGQTETVTVTLGELTTG